MTAIIIDTETTSLDKPEVIELAYLGPLDTPLTAADPGVQLQFKPSVAISLGAMCTHHIIDEDLDGCDPWPGLWEPPVGVTYLVGHNVDFDWKAIGSPNVKRICTLALARMVWPSIDSYSLGALIYHLYPHGMARKMVRGAHSALIDVELCNRVLFSLVDALQPRNWEHLWQISEKARIPTRFTFGKYGPRDGQKGTPIGEVRRSDPGYIRWCLTSCDIVTNDPYWQKALRGEAA